MRFKLSVPQISSILRFLSVLKVPHRMTQFFTLKLLKNKIIFSTTDLSNYAEVSIETNLEGNISLNLPQKIFQGLFRKLKSNEVECEVLGTKVRLITKNGEYEINGEKPDTEFPLNGHFEPYFIVSNNELKKGINKTSFAVSESMLSPLHFISFKTDTENLEVVGSDGYRLSMYSMPCSVLVSGKQLLANPYLVKSFCDYLPLNCDVQVGIQDNKVVFQMETARIAMSTTDSYPDYQKVLNYYSEYKTSFRVNRNSLMSTIIRAVGISDSCKMQFEDDYIKLTANRDEMSLNEYVPVVLEKNGDINKIYFNPKYVLDFLKVINDEEVIVKMTEELAPILFLGDSLVYLLMPKRGDENA